VSKLAARNGLERIVEIASEASQLVMSYYNAPGSVVEKGDASPLTMADLAANDLIVRALEALTPEVRVISEETAVPPAEERQAWRQFWLVDPLDGTKEFLSRNGEFTVNIALVEDGVPVVGVVAAPAADVVYFARRGQGAWRRCGGGVTERICASPPPADRTRVVESRSHPSAELEGYLATLGPIERQRVGSSLKFCRIAEGAADLYPRFGRTMEWDVAAGDCLYRNSTFDGSERPSPLRYNQPTLSSPRFVVGQPSACGAAASRADR
jgi:3'(2'), 5'-bisphosphate nucleotidase